MKKIGILIFILLLAVMVSPSFAAYSDCAFGDCGSTSGGGGISGLTTTYIPKATSSSTIGDSSVSDTSGLLGINIATATSDVHIKEKNAFDLVYTYNGSYTDKTAESKTTYGTAQTILFDNTQYLYLGKSTTFKDIAISLKQPTTAANTLNAEYWNGSGWTTLTITDNTNNLQNNGTITYTVPGSWATTAVNSQTYYWIRLFLTNTPSTAPTMYSVRPGSNGLISGFPNQNDTIPSFFAGADGNILSSNAAGGTPSVSTPTTIVVGLATSRQSRRVDFMCSGAKDQVCLNAAITACGSNACKIIVLEGTYNLTGSITPLKSNLEIEGVGSGLTIFKISNVTSAVFSDTSTGSTGSPLTNLSFHDFEIDRSSDTKDANVSRKGIFIKYMKNVYVYNTYMHDSGGSCIGIDFLNGAFIHDNFLVNCGTSSATTGSSGIGIGTAEYVTEPQVLNNNVILGSGYGGILIEAQGGATAGLSNNFIVSGNVLTTGSQYGIVIDNSSNIDIVGNQISGNTKDGIIIKNGSGSAPNDIVISGNNINGNTLYGLRVSSTTATNIHVNNNNMTGNGTAAILNSITSSLELTRLNNLGDTESFLENSFRVIAPAAQTISAGNIITADGCGTIKKITSAGAVTTNTTNTFTAPADANNGCCMSIVNSGSNNITLDNNANFVSAGAADVVMTGNDAVKVCSDGSKWYQISALLAN